MTAVMWSSVTKDDILGRAAYTVISQKSPQKMIPGSQSTAEGLGVRPQTSSLHDKYHVPRGG